MKRDAKQRTLKIREGSLTYNKADQPKPESAHRDRLFTSLGTRSSVAALSLHTRGTRDVQPSVGLALSRGYRASGKGSVVRRTKGRGNSAGRHEATSTPFLRLCLNKKRKRSPCDIRPPRNRILQQNSLAQHWARDWRAMALTQETESASEIRPRAKPKCVAKRCEHPPSTAERPQASVTIRKAC